MRGEFDCLAAMAVLTWLALFVASVAATRAWSVKGLQIAFGNREQLPEATPFAGRAGRAARNLLETLVLFTALLLAVQSAGKSGSVTLLGATLFLWSRLVYWPVYLIGIPYIRTLLWWLSIIGLALLVSALLL
jgi:uncharacterized MAPEG superfamily protein